MRALVFKKIFIIIVIILFNSVTTFPVTISNKIGNSIKLNSNSNNIGDDICDLLIISPSKFIRYLQPLICHKSQYDIRTKIVSLDYVYKQILYGRDDAEKVKLFIKEAIEETGIKYVLLVGGSIGLSNRWFCPVRYSQLSNNYEQQILSDLYFADIYDSEGNFSSWDDNGDGVFSEWIYGDQPVDKYLDLYPDIAVGRLPCKNSLEVMIMVKKIIRYEKTTYDKPWFRNMVAFAGDTYPECINPKWVGYEGEYYTDLAFENMTGFNQEKHYTSDGTLNNWSDINNALNKGWGFVYFNGHANAKIWNTYYANSTLRIEGYSIKRIRYLKNGDKLPVCVVGGCHSSQFDVSLIKYFNKKQRNRGEGINECWSWIMTRKIGGGSIATIGITALGHTKEDKESFEGGSCELEVQFFKQYGQNKMDIIGDAWIAAIKWYIDTYPVYWKNELTNDSWVDTQVVQTWALFGDPSLKIGGYPPYILESIK